MNKNGNGRDGCTGDGGQEKEVSPEMVKTDEQTKSEAQRVTEEQQWRGDIMMQMFVNTIM